MIPFTGLNNRQHWIKQFRNAQIGSKEIQEMMTTKGRLIVMFGEDEKIEDLGEWEFSIF